MSTLKLQCPHCTYTSEDPFEVLGPDAVDAMRCEQCGQEFWFAIMECQRCANEQVFSWRHSPATAALDLLTCEACASTFRRNNDLVEEQRKHRVC